jgi:hypothetical protein
MGMPVESCWPDSSSTAQLRSSDRALSNPVGPMAALASSAWLLASRPSRVAALISRPMMTTRPINGTDNAAASLRLIGNRRTDLSSLLIVSPPSSW